MSTRCNVKISQNGRVDYLYHHSDGDLPYIGAMVALAGRKAQESQIDDITMWLLNSERWNFRTTEGEHYDIEYFYHIDLLPSGNVIIGLANKEGYDGRSIEGETKRLKVSTFIKKVNRARRDTGLRKIRLPQTTDNVPQQPEPETGPRPYTLIEREQIAQTIIDQMGGLSSLRAMIGASNFLALDSPAGLKFDFKGCPATTHDNPANKCQVVYNPGEDNYDIEFYYYTRSRYAHCPKVHSVEGVYFGMLQDLFTGLTLSL